jgi:hypothetical protein
MSNQIASKKRGPSPLFGILAPGEKTTRSFPVLPTGVMPLLQNFPGGAVRLVEWDDHSVTIENMGSARAPFSILFVTPAQIQKLAVLKQAFDGISELRKKTQ